MIIIGIDPGVALVGYAVIKTKTPIHLRQNRNEKPVVIDFGCITTTTLSSAGDRLKIIHEGINTLIEKHNPDIISIESLYFFKNAKTVIPVSQARGVILLSAAKKAIPVMEFTPLQVKMTVVGYGRAEKKQVQKMTKELLDLTSFNVQQKNRRKDDAADALGIALCAFLKGNTIG